MPLPRRGPRAPPDDRKLDRPPLQLQHATCSGMRLPIRASGGPARARVRWGSVGAWGSAHGVWGYYYGSSAVPPRFLVPDPGGARRNFVEVVGPHRHCRRDRRCHHHSHHPFHHRSHFRRRSHRLLRVSVAPSSRAQRRPTPRRAANGRGVTRGQATRAGCAGHLIRVARAQPQICCTALCHTHHLCTRRVAARASATEHGLPSRSSA